MSYSSLWYQALKNDKARRVSTGMPPSRKRKREINYSNPERRSKIIRKEPPIFINPTKKTAIYDTMTGGAAVPHFFKQLGTGHQPQYGPRQHQSKIYAGIYKDASTQTLLSGPVSSSAPETDSPASDLDAEGYQPQPQPQNEICLPFYNDPNSQQLLDGQNLLDGVRSSLSKKKKHKKRSVKSQQPARPKRRHSSSPKTFKRDPNDPETPYNSLWENKENYKRVDMEEYLKKCQSAGPHPRSSYAGFVQR
jgi:hypothetical protein